MTGRKFQVVRLAGLPSSAFPQDNTHTLVGIGSYYENVIKTDYKTVINDYIILFCDGIRSKFSKP